MSINVNTFPAPPAWTNDALCAQIGGDEWYPEPGGLGQRKASIARATCAACPVRIKCLDYALANDERWGIWGGLFYSERAALGGSDVA